MQNNNTWQARQPMRKPAKKDWYFISITALLIIGIGMIPLGAYLFVNWNSLALNSSRAQSGPHQIQITPVASVQGATTDFQATQIAAHVDSLMQAQLAKQQFTGSVLIAVNHQIILARGYGQADDTSKTNILPETRFFLGSVTKEFTATAILLLQQMGKLQLQAHLCNYIPNCPAPWQAITVQEVLMHTSGIPAPDDSQFSLDSPAAWLATFNTLPLEFAPGAQFDYCSVCYQVLGYVVQHVSGKPYDQFLEQNIFEPLHMENTGFDANAYYKQANHTTGYASWQSPAMQLGWDKGSKWAFLDGSGLLYSTAVDLYRWDQALYTDTILPQTVLREAFTPRVNAAELFPGSMYGYGWFIAKSPVAGHRLIWHDGAIDGFRNYIGRYVDDQVTIIALSNLATVDPVALGHSLEKAVFAHLNMNSDLR